MIDVASVYLFTGGIEIANLQKLSNLMVFAAKRLDGGRRYIWTVNIWDTYQEVALYWVSAYAGAAIDFIVENISWTV